MKVNFPSLRRVVLCVAFVLLCFAANAQWNQFEKLLSAPNPPQHAVDIVAVPGGYTLIVFSDTQSITNRLRLSMVHTDMDGNVVWSKEYCQVMRCDFLEPEGSIITTSDNGYLITCAVPDTSGYGLDVALIKTDAAGSVMWFSRYGTASTDKPANLIQTSDGGYLLAVNKLELSSWSAYELLLYKLDANGAVQWNYEYQEQSDKLVWYDLVECAEGTGYFITGNRYGIRIDANGVGIWSKSYGYGFRRVFWNGNGFYGIGEDFYADVIVAELDVNGNMLWRKVYLTNFQATLVHVYDAIRTPDGGLAIVGSGYCTSDQTNRATLLRIDSTGTVRWYRAYPVTGNTYGYGLCQDYSGSFAFVGAHADFSFRQKVFFARTDSSGKSFCNEVNCALTDSMLSIVSMTKTWTRFAEGSVWPTVINPFPVIMSDSILCVTVGLMESRAVYGFSVDPNPSSGAFTINRTNGTQACDIRVLDATGKVVLYMNDAMKPGELRFDLEVTAASGLYLVQAITADELITTRVLVQ